MARFYGEMFGQARNKVSRTGGAASGVGAHVRGWNIGGKVEAFDRDGKDVILLQVTGGSGNPTIKETPWIELVQDRETGAVTITCRPGPEGKVIKW
jgi:hypothetical protein